MTRAPGEINPHDLHRRVRARRGAGQRRLHAWSFAQWQHFVVYKAEKVDLDVVALDPRHTSQPCSHCGFKYWAKWRSQALFQGRHCAYTLHADLNTAKNIVAKFRASHGNLRLVRCCQLAYRPLFHARRGIGFLL